MKKKVFILFFLTIVMVACSNNMENSKSSSDEDVTVTEEALESEEHDFSANTYGSKDKQERVGADVENTDDGVSNSKATKSDRKIIYSADLRIEVKDYGQTENKIQKAVADREGYIVSSDMYEDTEDGMIAGQLTVRIPQDSFRAFIQLVEDSSSKVLESSVSGEDVTEEYVDLKSRLKSKKVVEDRLLSFMETAEKTADLLSISNDLAKVQESIEAITGQMKYLENKTDLATVTIDIQEYNVTISGMNNKDLGTWEKTKQQFMKSINFLLSALSGLFIFIIGNLPVIILLGFIVLVICFMVRRQMRKK